MRTEIFERTDGATIVVPGALSGMDLRPAHGDVEHLGTIDLDPGTLSVTVATAMREGRCHVVAGADGDVVRNTLYPPPPVRDYSQPIWLG